MARQFGAWITNLGEQVGVLAILLPLALLLVGGTHPPLSAMVVLAGIGVFMMFTWAAIYQLLTLAPVALVWPILASNGALVSLLAIVFFGERPRAFQLVGLLMVLAGVVCTTYVGSSVARPTLSPTLLESEPGRSRTELIPSNANARTLLIAVGVSVLSGLAVFFVIVFVKQYGWYIPFAIERVGQLATALSLFAAGFPTRRHLLGHPSKWWLALPLVGLLDGVGLVMYGLGNQLGSTTMTAMSSSAFVVVPVILGIVLIGERPSRVQGIGIGGVVSGLILLAT